MPFFGGGTSDYKIVGTNIKGSPTSMPAVVGGNNAALGVGALPLLVGGTFNIAIGNSTGPNLIDSNANILIGYSAGNNLDETSNGNVLLSSFGNGILSPISDSIAIKGSVSGDNAISMGRSAVAGALAVAIGQGSNAPDNTVCIGNSANSSANYSVLIGDSLVDGGVVSVLIGDITARNVRVGAFDFSANPPLQVIEQSSVPVTLPNDTLENTILTVDVNPGLMRENSALFIDAIFQTASATGSLTLRLKADGVTIWTSTAMFGTNPKGLRSKIINKNDLALNKLIMEQLNSTYTFNVSPIADLTLDFNNLITFTVTAQKSAAADNINLAFSNFSFNQV